MNLIHKFNTPPPMKYKCGICASDMTEEELEAASKKEENGDD